MSPFVGVAVEFGWKAAVGLRWYDRLDPRGCQGPTPMTDWVNGLLEKKPFRLVSVALANKLARIAWAVLTRGETYRPYGQPA